MNKYWSQTQREKVGTIDGLNLFFGALLGANLGTLDGLALGEYAKLIALLAGAVSTIRVMATSERKAYAVAGVLIYGAILAGMLVVPALRPEGLAERDLDHLLVTLGVWLAAAVAIELFPTRGETEGQAAANRVR